MDHRILEEDANQNEKRNKIKAWNVLINVHQDFKKKLIKHKELNKQRFFKAHACCKLLYECSITSVIKAGVFASCHDDEEQRVCSEQNITQQTPSAPSASELQPG